MKCLITGGAGFIASHIADKLIEQGHEVAIIDNLSSGSKENINPKAKFYNADITVSQIKDIFEKEKPETVFHFAAQIDVRKSVQDPVMSANTNIFGTLNILENCKNFAVKKIIFSSTGGAMYDNADILPTPESSPCNPISPYAIEKLAAEYYIKFYKREFGLDFMVLRFANVYGPRQNPHGEAGVVAIFINKMLEGGQPLIRGDGKQTRDFIFIDDVVSAAVMAKDAVGGQILNIGTGTETDINTIFDALNGLLGLQKERAYAPENNSEQKRSCLDSSKAKEILGWSPKHDLDKGLMKTAAWFKNNNK